MIEPPAKDVSEDWSHDYTLLVLQLNRYITTLIDDDSMLDFYGLPEYLAQVVRNQNLFPHGSSVTRKRWHNRLQCKVSSRLEKFTWANWFVPSRRSPVVSRVKPFHCANRRSIVSICMSITFQKASSCRHTPSTMKPYQALAMCSVLQTWRAHHTLPSDKRHLIET